MVLVQIDGGGQQGLGYTYADAATGNVAQAVLAEIVHGQDVFAHAQIWLAMVRHVRNRGETGISQMAISAIDNALWDLHAKLVQVPLVGNLAAGRETGFRWSR